MKKPGADPGVASITKGMSALRIPERKECGAMSLRIPERKECGTLGRRTVVETNYLSLDLSKLRNKVAYHYDVGFEPALPKRLLRYV